MTFHEGALPYFSFPSLDDSGIKNGFTTKFGGVSEGVRAELSMGCENQSEEINRENYKRVLKTLHMNEKRPVLSYQTHTANVRVVTEEDVGKGPFRPRDYVDVDGLVTNLKDTPLVTLHADCVPLYFYDPVREVIGLSHAGWRGTLDGIAANTLKIMYETYGSDPVDVLCAIGPSICKDCYEVGEEVYQLFCEKTNIRFDVSEIFSEKENGKYLLNLQKANQSVLLHAGVSETHISISDICTKCNSQLLFSHRFHGNKRGLMAALISL